MDKNMLEWGGEGERSNSSITAVSFFGLGKQGVIGKMSQGEGGFLEAGWGQGERCRCKRVFVMELGLG